MKLYIYEHCPYCIRPRMIMALKNITIKIIYLSNDDEKTHLDLIGKKQVPFLIKNNSTSLIESLNICQYLNNLNNKPILNNKIINNNELIQLMNKINTISKFLVYPNFLKHPLNCYDFPTKQAKEYFKNKKAIIFQKNLTNKNERIEKTTNLLNRLNKEFKYFFDITKQISWDDILVFPILRNLTIIQDLINFPYDIKHYIYYFSQLSNIKLYNNIN